MKDPTTLETPPIDPQAQKDEWNRLTRLAYGITLAAMAVFIIIVSLYGLFGEDAVAALTEQNGEILLTQARTAAKAGNAGEAIQLYSKAIQGCFSTLDLKIWAMEEYVRYLLDQDRPREAVPVMIRAAELGPHRASAYDLLVHVFMQAEDYAAALQATDLWIERLQESEASEDLARAHRVRDRILKEAAAQERAP